MAGSPQTIGRYEVQQRLGAGGMGAIYLARDPAIDRLVAIKLLNADIAGDDLRRRFAHEARASGALSHPHIVTIHDFGEVDGAPFIVMEYVRGDTLAAIIKRAAPVSVVQKLRWMEQVCSALGYAHDKRVVHRDVKPSNLMVDQYDTIRVVDFGIARIIGDSLTKTSMVVGTPGYMSPEQLQGGTIDARSDLFAVGAVLYELLSYHEAFAGDTPHAIMHRVVATDPPPLGDLLAGPDLSIVAVVETALKKDPNERFANMAELEAAIRRSRMALEAAGHDLVIRAASRTPSDLNKWRRRRTDPVDLVRRRAEQIERSLETARQAHDVGDIDRALSACEVALLIDPSSVAALALMEKIQKELSGISAASAVAPATTGPVDTRLATAVSRRSVGFQDIELSRAATDDRTGPPGPLSATIAGIDPPSRPARRRWPWAAGAAVVTLAAGGWLVLSGVVPMEWQEESASPVDLTMPPLPVEAPATSTPARTRPATSQVSPVGGAILEPAAATAGRPAPARPSAEQTPKSVEPSRAPPAGAAVSAPEPPAATSDQGALDRALRRAEGAESNGNITEALGRYREALKLDPSNAIAGRGVIRVRVGYLIRRAESLILSGDYAAALKDLDAVAADDPKNERAAELRTAIEQGKSSPTRKPPSR